MRQRERERESERVTIKTFEYKVSAAVGRLSRLLTALCGHIFLPTSHNPMSEGKKKTSCRTTAL